MVRPTGDFWFYHPNDHIYASPSDVGVEHESVWFESEGFRLHAWFFPARIEPLGTIVHAHGNAGNITGHFQYVAMMPSLGWNVLCFDYRGYGRSQGRPARAGTIADTHAAIDCAHSRADVDGSRVVLFGQSLGGSIAAVVAAGRDDLAGVAIEGAFAGYRRVARYVCRRAWLLRGVASLLSRLLVADGFDPLDSVARIAPTPTFFIGGTADQTCDPQDTQLLFDAAGEPRSLWMIEDGTHCGAMTETDGEGCARLHEFFRSCVEGQRPTGS